MTGIQLVPDVVKEVSKMNYDCRITFKGPMRTETKNMIKFLLQRDGHSVDEVELFCDEETLEVKFILSLIAGFKG